MVAGLITNSEEKASSAKPQSWSWISGGNSRGIWLFSLIWAYFLVTYISLHIIKRMWQINPLNLESIVPLREDKSLKVACFKGQFAWTDRSHILLHPPYVLLGSATFLICFPSKISIPVLLPWVPLSMYQCVASRLFTICTHMGRDRHCDLMTSWIFTSQLFTPKHIFCYEKTLLTYSHYN